MQEFNVEEFVADQIKWLQEAEREKVRISAMSDEKLNNYRIIHTKRRPYLIPKTQTGIPIEEHLKNANIPENLKGAKVYMTKDGAVIARQFQ